MNTNVKVDDLILQLQSAHDQLNEILFSSKLTPVQITIENGFRRRRNTLGSFYPGTPFNDNKNVITLWSTGINGEYYDVLGTLVHEMVHQYNHLKGTKDVENNGRHNKKFLCIAQNLGKLNSFSNSSSTVGYGITKPSDELKKVFDQLDLDKEPFKLVHENSLGDTSMKYKNQIKYKCIGCDLVVTVNRPGRIMCMDCTMNLERYR